MATTTPKKKSAAAVETKSSNSGGGLSPLAVVAILLAIAIGIYFSTVKKDV